MPSGRCCVEQFRRFRQRSTCVTNPYSEGALVERPAIALLGQLDWDTVNCFDEVFGDPATAGPGCPYLGRETE